MKENGVDDHDIAMMIAREARQQAELSRVIGPSAFLRRTNPSTFPSEKGSVNKTFLRNTIRDVEAHNRREEIDESWRHHDLLKRKRPYDRMSNSCEDIVEEERPLSNRTDHDNDYEASRQEWSRKKLRSIAGPSNDDQDDSSSSSSSSSSSASSQKDKKKKKHKKERKRKHKKEKKSKKKKKKER